MSSWSPCPVYDIHLDAPDGQPFAALPAEAVARAKAVLADMRARVPGAVLLLARAFDWRTGGRFGREARQIAAATGVDWRWLMMANVSYDLIISIACSTVALPTSAGPVVARNLDWWPPEKLAAASCLLRYVRGGRMKFAVPGWAGSIGAATGLSGRGFAVVLNAVLGCQRCRWTGWPVLLLLRRVLEDAGGFDEAVAMLSRDRLFANCILTVVGVRNQQRVCIERTPTRAACRWGRAGEALVATNFYQSLGYFNRRSLSQELAASFDGNRSRFGRLKQLGEGLLAAGRTDTESLVTALADPGVMQESTAQHIVMRPAEQSVEVFAAACDPMPRVLPIGAVPPVPASSRRCEPVSAGNGWRRPGT
jgi:hypothetical protein